MNKAQSSTGVLSNLNTYFYSLIPIWVASVILLLISNVSSFLRIVPESFGFNEVPTDLNVGTVLDRLLTRLGTIPHIDTITTFVFWSMAGIIVYLAIISVYSLIFAASNDVDELTHYVYPISVKKTSVWYAKTLNWIVFFCLCVLTIILLVSVLIILLPVCRELFIAGVRDPTNILAWLTSIASSLSLALSLSALLFLIRLNMRSYRVL